MGVLDFAGGTVVHMTAGIAALAGALFIGRREMHREKREHVPANIPRHHRFAARALRMFPLAF
ncbi:MAG: ammonium transporter, partial [Candidatus Obscuribacterales bacterium]|nr:ammonium transporter [Steroidobacteraceae bacterium]